MGKGTFDHSPTSVTHYRARLDQVFRTLGHSSPFMGHFFQIALDPRFGVGANLL